MSVGQAEFAAAILDPERSAPDGLLDPEGAPVGKRFDVYRNNVAFGLTEALETGFPAIRKLVGNSNFRLLAGAHLRLHPPASPLMMHYGESMPEFLESFEPVARYPYLPDVARLELALRQSYHAADSDPVDPAIVPRLKGGPLLASRIGLAPAVRLVRSRWPVHSVWRFNMEPGSPKPEMRGENVLIARPEFDPVMTVLPQGGGVFMSAIMGGSTVAESIEAALERVPGFDPAPTLEALARGSAISAVHEEERS